MTDDAGFFAIDANEMPWEPRDNPHLPATIFRKVLLVSNKPFSIQYDDRGNETS
jgi:hypothetical protein